MSEPHQQVDLQQPAQPQQVQDGEGAGSGLFTIGLFLVMVVFVIGCMFLGWFQ